MRYPAFFDAVPSLSLRDPLAQFLGALGDGIVEYAYLDAVRLAGHSCPTVASAYWVTQRALAALYPSDLPERGGIRIDFRADGLAGVTGVVANVVSMLTGATHDTGFKGLSGRFDRRRLMFFGAAVPLEYRYTRCDTGAAVEAIAHLQRVPGDPALPELMQRCLSGAADVDEAARFGAAWQDRVRRILLDHGNDPEVFVIQASGQ